MKKPFGFRKQFLNIKRQYHDKIMHIDTRLIEIVPSLG